jgi:hypothetical protein
VFPNATIPAGDTQTMRARFLICDGEMPPADVIQKAWNDYTGRSDPVPKMGQRSAEFGKSPDEKKKATPEADKKKVN